VLRFEHRAVFEHPEGVLETIKNHLTPLMTTPDPS
jgi:very-short-patch-repair endonuclease